MLMNVFARTLGERKRATILFAVAIAALFSMYVSVFPDMQDQMADYSESLPDAMQSFVGGNLGDPGGYLQATIFTILGPVLLVAAAVTWGAAAIAGEEENRTLPMLLSVPVARFQVAWQKAAGVAVLLTALAGVAFLVLLAWVGINEMDISAGTVFGATLHLHAFSLLVAGLAFAVGAATGRKSLAIGAALGVVVAGYVMSAVADMADGAEALEWLSPFHWYSGTEPIIEGAHGGYLVLLYGLALVIAAAGAWLFNRRDLS